MSFPKSTTMRNPKIAPRLPMARCAGFHYRLLAAVETRIGPILKLDSKAVPDKLQGKGVSGRLLNWRHHPLRYVSREEETMGLTNLPEYISAIVAIIALLISCYQARLSNKQSLFNRRINIWITVDKLVSVYAKNAKNLEHNDEPQLAIDRLFVWLTNTTYLQSISASINHVLDADPQLKLHLKLDEMKSLAMEARFCFKGKSGDAIAEFIEAYQSLLFSMYQYQILLNKRRSCHFIQDSMSAKQAGCNSAANTASRPYMALRDSMVYMLICSSTPYLPIVQASYLMT